MRSTMSQETGLAKKPSNCHPATSPQVEDWELKKPWGCQQSQFHSLLSNIRDVQYLLFTNEWKFYLGVYGIPKHTTIPSNDEQWKAEFI